MIRNYRNYRIQILNPKDSRSMHTVKWLNAKLERKKNRKCSIIFIDGSVDIGLKKKFPKPSIQLDFDTTKVLLPSLAFFRLCSPCS